MTKTQAHNPLSKREKPSLVNGDAAQSEAFIAKARELEAEREGAGDELMGRMAKMKPEPREKKKPPPKRGK